MSMFDSEYIGLTTRAGELLARAESTPDDLPREDINALLTLKYEADRLSKRITNALYGEVPSEVVE